MSSTFYITDAMYGCGWISRLVKEKVMSRVIELLRDFFEVYQFDITQVRLCHLQCICGSRWSPIDCYLCQQPEITFLPVRELRKFMKVCTQRLFSVVDTDPLTDNICFRAAKAFRGTGPLRHWCNRRKRGPKLFEKNGLLWILDLVPQVRTFVCWCVSSCSSVALTSWIIAWPLTRKLQTISRSRTGASSAKVVGKSWHSYGQAHGTTHQ